MRPRRIVVVGAGIAGHRCVLELRARGFDGEVVLVGAEPHLPYDRTLLSKAFLEGTVGPGEIALASRSEYEAQDILLRLGVAATMLDAEAHELVLADGERLSYDRLVIATGGGPVRPRSLDGPGVRVLRTIDDAEALRSDLAGAERLVVIGGGFVGGEIATSARSLGVEVTMVEALAAPLTRVVGDAVGERVGALHRECGVDLVTDARADAIASAPGGGLAVTLAGGRVVEAEAALMGIGMVPATGWLAGSGIELEGGIVTDEFCRTSVADVFAAGDCARWWHPGLEALVRVEHWDTAGRHGAAAARSALDEHEPFAPVPFFWSTQHGVRFQAVGHLEHWDTVEIEDGPERLSFVARYQRGGRLVGAFAAGQPRTIAAINRERRDPEVVPA